MATYHRRDVLPQTQVLLVPGMHCDANTRKDNAASYNVTHIRLLLRTPLCLALT